MPWSQIYSERGDRLEILLVPGGYLARNWCLAGEHSAAPHVSLVFCPGEPPEPIATAPPVNVDIPYVSGTGTIGESLSVTVGNWTNTPTAYSYAWAADGVPNGGTGDTYTVLAPDEGKSIACIVTATNAIGSTAAPPSNAVAAVAATRNARR